MATFIPNYDSSKSIEDQWKTHLQAQAYVNDVATVVEKSIDAYNARAEELQQTVSQAAFDISDSVADAAVAQIEAARANAAAIVGAIDTSTAIVSDAVNSVARIIESVGQTLDERLSLLIDQQRVGNLLMQNVAELLRIPDFQKERLHYIQQGFKHYQNARIDSSLMKDALANLLKAEERESSDYIVLHRIGMIYLYELINLPAAEQYFLRAGKYASVESEPAAARVAFVLSEGTSLADGYADIRRVRNLAADAYVRAAQVCYLQQRVEDAVAYAHRATELDPEYSLATFSKAKYLAVAGRSQEAVPLLESLITAERCYAISVADDGDLASKPEVRDLLTRLRDRAHAALQIEVADIEKRRPPFLDHDGELHSEYAGITADFNEGKYLSLLRGLDIVPKIKPLVRAWRDTTAAFLEFRSRLRSSPLATSALEQEYRLSLGKSFTSVLSARALLCKPHQDSPDVEGYLRALATAEKEKSLVHQSIAELEEVIASSKLRWNRLNELRDKGGDVGPDPGTKGFASLLQQTDIVFRSTKLNVHQAEGCLDAVSYNDCIAAEGTMKTARLAAEAASQDLRSKLRNVEAEIALHEQRERNWRAQVILGIIVFVVVMGLMWFPILTKK